MKRKLVILLILLVSFATTTFCQGLKFGFKVGTDIHKLKGIAFKDQFSFGYHLGAFAQLDVNSKWGIQPELLFSQVNSDTSDRFSAVYAADFNKISKIKLSYLKIPVLLNYKVNPFIALQAGPQFGILINEGSSLLKNGKDAFRKGDFSMIGGLELKIAKLRIYGRYGIGLNNINDVDDREKWKNQTVQLGIGFTL